MYKWLYSLIAKWELTSKNHAALRPPRPEGYINSASPPSCRPISTGIHATHHAPSRVGNYGMHLAPLVATAICYMIQPSIMITHMFEIWSGSIYRDQLASPPPIGSGSI